MHDAIRTSRTDNTEIRLERSWVTTVAQRGRRLEGATTGADEGGCVRVLHHGHGWGVASFNSLERLPAMVERARELSLAYQVRGGSIIGHTPGVRLSGNVFRCLERVLALGKDRPWLGSVAVPAVVVEGFHVAS